MCVWGGKRGGSEGACAVGRFVGEGEWGERAVRVSMCVCVLVGDVGGVGGLVVVVVGIWR